MAWINTGAVYGCGSGPLGLRPKEKITDQKIMKYIRDNAEPPVGMLLRQPANIIALGEEHWAIPPKVTFIASLMVGLSKRASQNMLYFTSEYFKRSMRSKITAYVEASQSQRARLAATLPEDVLKFKKVLDLAAIYPGGRCAVLAAGDSTPGISDPTRLANLRNEVLYNVLMESIQINNKNTAKTIGQSSTGIILLGSAHAAHQPYWRPSTPTTTQRLVKWGAKVHAVRFIVDQPRSSGEEDTDKLVPFSGRRKTYNLLKILRKTRLTKPTYINLSLAKSPFPYLRMVPGIAVPYNKVYDAIVFIP